jgi:hypothetical protein
MKIVCSPITLLELQILFFYSNVYNILTFYTRVDITLSKKYTTFLCHTHLLNEDS